MQNLDAKGFIFNLQYSVFSFNTICCIVSTLWKKMSFFQIKGSFFYKVETMQHMVYKNEYIVLEIVNKTFCNQILHDKKKLLERYGLNKKNEKKSKNRFCSKNRFFLNEKKSNICYKSRQ